MKKCNKCQIEKPLESFGKLKGGHNARCKACRNSYGRARYAQHEDKTHEWLDRRAWDSGVRQPLRGKCLDCQTTAKSYHAMSFVRRSDGTVNVPRMLRTWGVSMEQVLAEIAECDVVCSNCQIARRYYDSERAFLVRMKRSGKA